MRVFLIGFMGAGKSTTGRALARRLRALFWDLDARVEASLAHERGRDLRGDWARRRSAPRRRASSRRARASRTLVVATGGGTFALEANRELISRLGRLGVPRRAVGARCCGGCPGKRDERPLFAHPRAGVRAVQQPAAALPAWQTCTVRPEAGEDAEALAGRLALLLGEVRVKYLVLSDIHGNLEALPRRARPRRAGSGATPCCSWATRSATAPRPNQVVERLRGDRPAR